MHKLLFLIVIITVVFFVACSSESIPESEDLEDNNGEGSDKIGEEIDMDRLSDLEGILWEADGKMGIVLSHGAIYDAASWEIQGKELANNDIAAFAVEAINKEELIIAGKLLKDELKLDKVFLIGASAGGATSIEALKADGTIFDKVVLLSPGGDATTVEDIPVFVIYSEGEGYVNLEESKATNLKLLEIPGNAHAQRIFNDKQNSSKVMEELINFLKEE